MAFVDFLDPTPPPRPPVRSQSPNNSGEFSRFSYRPSSSNGLRKATIDRTACGASSLSTTSSASTLCSNTNRNAPLLSPASSLASERQPTSVPASPHLPPLSTLERRASMSNHGSMKERRPATPSGARSPLMGSVSPAPPSPYGPSSRQSPTISSNQQTRVLLHTFERSQSRLSLTGSSMDCSDTSSNPDSPTRELFAANGEEDLANDEALGQFLSATNAAARARRQRQTEEALPYSRQFLNSSATRRNRRMSSDSAVCEMRPWVNELQGANVAAKREAARGIRNALKDGPENRMRLLGAEGVRPLIDALTSSDDETVDHAATAVLFLSMAGDSAREVVSCGGIRRLVEVVKASKLESAKSNSAAALFALSHTEEHRRLIYQADALNPLVAFLKAASSIRAKKDACLALFNLTSLPKAPEEMVAQGVVERAVELCEEAEEGVEEKAAALLAGLAKTPAGVKAIEADEDALYALADTLEGGAPGAAQQAAIALKYMSDAYPSEIIPRILAEGCLPPLVRLASQSKKGSDPRLLLDTLRAHCTKRAKEEAQAREAMSKRVRSLERDAACRLQTRFKALDSRRASFSMDR